MPTGPQRVYMGKPHSVLAGRRGHPVNVGETERMISAIAGGALALYGLRRGSLGGLLIAGLGAALGYRGITGNCQLYEKLGIDSGGAHRNVGNLGVTISLSILTPRLPTLRRAPPGSRDRLGRGAPQGRQARSQDRKRSRWP